MDASTTVGEIGLNHFSELITRLNNESKLQRQADCIEGEARTSRETVFINADSIEPLPGCVDIGEGCE